MSMMLQNSYGEMMNIRLTGEGLQGTYEDEGTNDEDDYCRGKHLQND